MISYISKKKKEIFEDRNFKECLIYLFLYILNKITYTQIFKMMVLEETASKAFLKKQKEDEFTFKALNADELQNYTYSHRLDQGFIQESAKRDDRVFISTKPQTNEIVSYGWYTAKPLQINEHVTLHFPKSYIYMFNGFTEKDYRGYRLHGRGMALYALSIINEGYKGLVSYVDADNYRSLHSCARLGYRIIGTIMAIKIFGKVHFLSFGGCSKVGVYMTDAQLSVHNDLMNEEKNSFS